MHTTAAQRDHANVKVYDGDIEAVLAEDVIADE